MVRVRTRCTACEEHLNLGEEEIRLVREADSAAHYLCYQCPTCRCEARTVVRASALRSLLDAGVQRRVVSAVDRTADEWPAWDLPAHPRVPAPRTPPAGRRVAALDEGDLAEFMRLLDRPSDVILTELEGLVAGDYRDADGR